MVQTRYLSTGNVRSARSAKRTKFSCRVKQWELVEFVGAGGMARIYRARPAGSPADQPANYAVKMLRPGWQDDPRAVQLLRREALVGRSVSHPHLAAVLSASVSEPPPLLVMPWLEGTSLRARLAAGPLFDVPSTLWIARQTAEAMSALDAAGWRHGDISPSNIHVSLTGHVTLLDLSFAKRHDECGSAAQRPILGTCNYIAPEHLTSALRPDVRSDIYSLGAVMFEMLSGVPPFAAGDLAELAALHKNSTSPDWTRLASNASREVVRLVRSMTAREPLRRPQTPRELLDRLVAIEISTFSERAW
jgi:eukaryotic-like serine/threonine-protein kinase